MRYFLFYLVLVIGVQADVIIDATNSNGGFISQATGFNGSPEGWTAKNGVWIDSGNTSLNAAPFGSDTEANSRFIQIHDNAGEVLTSDAVLNVAGGELIELSFDYKTHGTGVDTTLTVTLWDESDDSTYATLGTLSTATPQSSFKQVNFSTTATTASSTLRLRFTMSAGQNDFHIDRVHLSGGTLVDSTIHWGAPFVIGNDTELVLNSFDPTRNGGGEPSEEPEVIAAVNYGYSGVVVNGIEFTNFSGSTDYWGVNSLAGTPTGLDPELDRLLSGHVAPAGTATPQVISLNGLSVGKSYQIQVIVGHDNRSGIRERQYEVSFGGNDFTSNGTPPVLTRGAQLVNGAYDTVVGSFVAVSPTMEIAVRSKDGLAANTDPAISAYILIGDPAPPAAPVEYAEVQHLELGDSDERIVEKAAKLLPSPKQVDWQRMENTFFIHFGLNTFNQVEWGTGLESPSVFNPTELDATQWAREIKNAGGKMLMLVVKHHEGFCLWPSRYTDHTVAASPWLGGNGDLVRQVAEACAAEGLKLGIYLSPADLYQIESRPVNYATGSGLYGNGSSVKESLIPTDPASFGTDPSIGRTPPEGKPTFTYEVDDYNRYFLNQLYELLTDYGPVHELWFDGAHPKQTNPPQLYNRAAWYELINELAPDAVIAIKGPDVRWVGNESGVARTSEWSPLPIPSHPDSHDWSDMMGTDLGSREKLTRGSYLTWYPAETDVPVLHGWFWSPGKGARTATELINIYYTSVGRNSNLLLNLSPDNRGLIPEKQLVPLQTMAQVIQQTFETDLADGASVSADSALAEHPAALARDGDLDTWWEPEAGNSTPTYTLELPAVVSFDVVSVQEAIATCGQRVENFAIDVWSGGNWVQKATDTTIGHRKLVRLDTPVSTDKVRVRFLQSRLEPSLAAISLHLQAEMVNEPEIVRDALGMVTLSATSGDSIRYTLDGSEPTSSSVLYDGSFSLPLGGVVRAVAFRGNGSYSLPVTRSFGLAPTGWTATADSAHGSHPAAYAIDENPDTYWHTDWDGSGQSGPHPHRLQIDMDEVRWISGFIYLPRQDGALNGVVRGWRCEVSLDGSDWTTVGEGEFDNIRNNPVAQTIVFPESVKARYLRFVTLDEVNDGGFAAAAEISILAGGFDLWRAEHGLQDQSGAMDADGDGLSNWEEYVLGTDPWKADQAFIGIEWDSESVAPGVVFVQPAGREDVECVLQVVDDLRDPWQEVPFTIDVIAVNPDGSRVLRYEEVDAPENAERRFYRLKFRAVE